MKEKKREEAAHYLDYCQSFAPSAPVGPSQSKEKSFGHPPGVQTRRLRQETVKLGLCFDWAQSWRRTMVGSSTCQEEGWESEERENSWTCAM